MRRCAATAAKWAVWSNMPLRREWCAWRSRFLLSGERIPKQITDAVSAYLGMALANAMYLVDTENIVFGDGVSKAGELLLQKVEKAYRSRVFAHSREKEFLLAKLGNAAGMRGAAALLLQKIK